ncbi:MAG TPA: methyltransferase domain-containing protein [Chitinophagaceae bacterium]|nr:methyltransferase domain-containing protein [Chitinophagaceae bacterium]
MTAPANTKWNASLYDGKHSFVFKYGEDLVELLQPKEGERILDLGCGTGYLTNMIAARGTDVTGIDNSEEMIAKAKVQFPELQFYKRSATDFHFDRPFDAIFSNAVLHWVLEKEKAIDCIYENLDAGGRFIMEMGGKGNVQNILAALKKSLEQYGYHEQAGRTLWCFPSIGEYATLLEQCGFRVTYALHFNRETELADDQNGIIDWLKMFAGGYLTGINAQDVEMILKETQEKIRPLQFKNGKWYADYKRLRVIAVK